MFFYAAPCISYVVHRNCKRTHIKCLTVIRRAERTLQHQHIKQTVNTHVVNQLLKQRTYAAITTKQSKRNKAQHLECIINKQTNNYRTKITLSVLHSGRKINERFVKLYTSRRTSQEYHSDGRKLREQLASLRLPGKRLLNCCLCGYAHRDCPKM